MTKFEAILIKKLMDKMAREEDDYDCTIVEDYSGRGMYGETTVGITFNHILCVVTALMTYPNELIDENNDPIITEISNYRLDQMGHKIIMY